MCASACACAPCLCDLIKFFLHLIILCCIPEVCSSFESHSGGFPLSRKNAISNIYQSESILDGGLAPSRSCSIGFPTGPNSSPLYDHCFKMENWPLVEVA